MKCDELKAGTLRTPHDEGLSFETKDGSNFFAVNEDKDEFYTKPEVDAAIAELKAKLESVQASMYADVVDANMENRKLKRALWLDRAKRAHVTTLLWNIYCYQNNCLYFRDFMNVECNPFRRLPKKTAMEWSDLWESIETKCLKKAEEADK